MSACFIIDALSNSLPAVFGRSAISKLMPGVIAPGTLANSHPRKRVLPVLLRVAKSCMSVTPSLRGSKTGLTMTLRSSLRPTEPYKRGFSVGCSQEPLEIPDAGAYHAHVSIMGKAIMV